MRKTKRFLKTENGKVLLNSYPDSADKLFAMLPQENGSDTTKYLIF